MTFKTIRICILVSILAYISLDTFLIDKRATDWKRSLRVVIYPINADGSVKTDKYIKQLKKASLDDINHALITEGKKFRKSLNEPIRFGIADALTEKPPALPKEQSALHVLMWSIKLRYWSWKNDSYSGPKPQVKAYALFFDPEHYAKLPHSTGIKKAKISINYLFSDKKYTKQNNVIILHELLHTLGATDKYDLKTGQPHFPQGFSNSRKQPLYPQKFAEIMGGRIALSEFKAKIPHSLTKVIIGPMTAKEIGWIK